jgi:uncharacterized protein (TIGR04255 family)
MQYVAPPIIEAVVQYSFADQIRLGLVSEVADLLAARYPSKTDRRSVSSTIDLATADVKSNVEHVGYDLVNVDGNRTIIAEIGSLVFSQRGSYSGWSEFSEWINSEIQIFSHLLNDVPISRLGVRFVNRLDIPIQDGLGHFEDYVTVYPRTFPFGGENLSRFVVSFGREIPESNIGFNITCGTVESPAPSTLGILLDIDSFAVLSKGEKIGELIGTISALRDVKNRVFENAITDAARAKFGVKHAS